MQEQWVLYQFLVGFYLEVASFINNPNPLAPVNQGVTLFFDMFNCSPSLYRDYKPRYESTPEAAWYVCHLIVPSNCGNTSAVFRASSAGIGPWPWLFWKETIIKWIAKHGVTVIVRGNMYQFFHYIFKLTQVFLGVNWLRTTTKLKTAIGYLGVTIIITFNYISIL